MFKKISAIFALSLLFASPVFANGLCEMKNLEVKCENGDKIKLDVARASSDVFLTINTKEALGDYILLSINGNKPEILKMTASSLLSKRAHLSYSLISKLKNATSIQFKIVMNKRKPISGQLGNSHFEWLKRFGKKCS